MTVETYFVRKSLHRRLLEAAKELRYEIETIVADPTDRRGLRYEVRGANQTQILTPGEAVDFFGIPVLDE